MQLGQNENSRPDSVSMRRLKSSILQGTPWVEGAESLFEADRSDFLRRVLTRTNTPFFF